MARSCYRIMYKFLLMTFFFLNCEDLFDNIYTERKHVNKNDIKIKNNPNVRLCLLDSIFFFWYNT